MLKRPVDTHWQQGWLGLGALAFASAATLLPSSAHAQPALIEYLLESRNDLNREIDDASIEDVSSPVRGGQKAWRHTLPSDGGRAEFKGKKLVIGETYWYGWSYQVPDSWTTGSAVIAQWAAFPSNNKDFGRTGCGAVGSAMWIGPSNKNCDRSFDGNTLSFTFQRAGDTDGVLCTCHPIATLNEIRGRWIDFVMHVKWTGDDDGFLKLWMRIENGAWVRKMDVKGPTFWNDEGTGPYTKLGAYAGKGPNRSIYTDEYRLAGANATFETVAPGPRGTAPAAGDGSSDDDEPPMVEPPPVEPPGDGEPTDGDPDEGEGQVPDASPMIGVDGGPSNPGGPSSGSGGGTGNDSGSAPPTDGCTLGGRPASGSLIWLVGLALALGLQRRRSRPAT